MGTTTFVSRSIRQVAQPLRATTGLGHIDAGFVVYYPALSDLADEYGLKTCSDGVDSYSFDFGLCAMVTSSRHLNDRSLAGPRKADLRKV